MEIELKKISLYRKELMGLAIVFIMICHTTIVYNNEFLDYLNTSIVTPFFQIGVDIFMLLSGMGCYYSLQKEPNYKAFLWKRFKRIMPAYFLIVGLYCIIALLFNQMSLQDILYRYSLITFFTNGELLEWFIASIIILYLLVPLFLYRFKSKKGMIIFAGFITIISFLLSLIDLPLSINIVNEIFIVRIPCFILGIITGKMIIEKENIKLSRKSTIISILVLIILFVLVRIASFKNCWWLSRILFCPLSLLFCLIFGNIFNKFNNFKIKSLFSLLGGITLEIYLIHEKIQPVIKELLFFLVNDTLIIQFIYTILSMIIAVFISLLVSKTLKKIIN